ncbi:MAG: hypothetical protein AAFY10_06150 [Pseudomonadota bacterium]
MAAAGAALMLASCESLPTDTDTASVSSNPYDFFFDYEVARLKTQADRRDVYNRLYTEAERHCAEAGSAQPGFCAEELTARVVSGMEDDALTAMFESERKIVPADAMTNTDFVFHYTDDEVGGGGATDRLYTRLGDAVDDFCAQTDVPVSDQTCSSVVMARMVESIDSRALDRRFDRDRLVGTVIVYPPVFGDEDD